MYLIASDLHLTDNFKDEYRWGLFPWMVEQIEKYDVTKIFILGDITDLKDNHSSKLTNRIVQSILLLTERGVSVIILKGNHDYLLEDYPYFKFLNSIENVVFVSEPKVYRDWLLLPHTRDPKTKWKKFLAAGEYELILAHLTMYGSLTSNGYKMEEGLQPSIFKNQSCRIISGDIHVPQTMGKVMYVGAPYHIKFGDTFNARCLLISEDVKSFKSIFYETIKKCIMNITTPHEVFNIVDEEELIEGDHVKVRLHLPPSLYSEWANYKADIKKIAVKQLSLNLFGIELIAEAKERFKKESTVSSFKTSRDYFESYCKHEHIEGETYNVGEKVISSNDIR